MNHSINKEKVEAELVRRGWKRGVYKEWVTPLAINTKSFEEDWTAAILAGVECLLEKKIEDNKEFIAKHPSQTRHM